MLTNKLVALEAGDMRKLKRLAKLHRKSVNEMIRAAVWRYLDDFADDLKLGSKTIADVLRKAQP